MPRLAETLENTQAKLHDPQSGNFAYVRFYNSGLHTVIVSADGDVVKTEAYDHGLIIQFAEKYAGRGDSFEVVWENASRSQSSTQTASTGKSDGDAPYSPAAKSNIQPPLAEAIGIDSGVVAKATRLTLLSPTIVHKLILGEADLSMQTLRRSFPLVWEKQESELLK